MRQQLHPPFLVLSLVWLLGVMNLAAQNATPQTANGSWQPVVDRAVQTVLAKFASKKITTNQLAVTLIDLLDASHPVSASYRGDVAIYPASVVKLFYLVAAERWLEDRKLQDTPELRRALHDMIVYSYNEATHLVVDALTDTTSGPELPPAEIKPWFEKRNAVNRYFASLGYTNINVNKKPWNEGPYGRETQAMALFEPKRNQLTTDATARLMVEIMTGKAVSPFRCEEMRKLLSRTPANPNDSQSGFIGAALPKGAKLWSKAGWTSQVRHDAAYIELPDGAKFVLVIFTTEQANNPELIPALTQEILAGIIAK